MSLLSKNIKAFSVLEAVFSMVITAIIIGVVFIIFEILSERMIDFRRENQFIADLNRLNYVINKDAFENDEMMVYDSELLFSSSTGEKTRYLVEESYFLRKKSEFIDTFYFRVNDLKMDTLKDKNQKNVFQKLNLEIDSNDDKVTLDFYKRIYSNEFIKSLKIN